MGRITRTNYGLTSEVRLSHAQILALFTVPVVLVAARVGTIWFPWALSIVSNTVAGAYATVANFFLGVTGTLNYWNTVSLANSGLSSGALDQRFELVAQHAVGVQTSNLPLILSANASPTAGNVANFAIVRVFYVESRVS